MLSAVAVWAPIQRVQAESCEPLTPESCLPEPGGTPLAGANVGLNKACTEQGGSYTDRTTVANNNGVGGTVDFTLGDNALNTGSNAVYIAMNYLFITLVVDVGTAGATGTVAWEYWSGAWTAFSGVTDNTNNLRNSGVNTVTWTLPSDWVAHDPGFTNCAGNGFYARIRTTANYLSVPVADQVSAVEYNLQMSAQTELAGAVTGLAQAAFTVAVVGSGDSTVYAFREVGSGAYQWALHGVSGTHNYTIVAAKDGHVDSPSQWTTPLNTTLRTISAASLPFAYKVTGVTTEMGSSLSGVTVRAGDAKTTTCTESGGNWFCAVPVGDTELKIEAEKDGYVTDNLSEFATDRTSSSAAQVTGTVTGVQFSYKVSSVQDEIAQSVSGVTVAAGDGQNVACTESGSAWYCPVPVAHTTLTIRAAKDGYVTNLATSFASDRTDNANPQATAAVSGLQFAFKVTAVASEIGTSLSDATVSAGDSQGVTCTGSGGAWYCPVPVSHTTLSIQAARDGYVTDVLSSFGADRDDATDAQVSGSVTNVRFAYKVTTVSTETGTSLTQVAVDAGDAQAVICTEWTADWYCAVPVAHTSTTIRANKTGYVTDTGSSFSQDRTSAADAQVVGTVSNMRYALTVTVVTEEDLTGVTFESNVNGAGWQSATPDGTSSNVAYFAMGQDQLNVVYRATKASVTGTTGAGFQTVYTGQTQRTISLIGPLAPTTVRVRDLTVSAGTSYAFSFTNYHAWPAAGKLVVQFPATYSFGSPAVTLTNAEGTASAAVAGTTVTITRSGGSSVSASTAVTVRLTDIHNPGAAGVTADFDLALQDGAGVSLDEGVALGVEIKPTPVVEFDFVNGASTVAVDLSPAGPGDWFVDSLESTPSPIEVDAAGSNRNILLYFDPDDLTAQVKVNGSAADVALAGLDYETTLDPAPSAGTWRSGGTTRTWSATNADSPGLWIFFDDGRTTGTIRDNESLMDAANEAAASTANAGNEFSPALIAADAGDEASPSVLPTASRLRWSTGSAPSASDYAFEVVVPFYVETAGGSGAGAGGTLESRYVQLLMRADGSEVAVREGGAAALGADWDVAGWDRAKAPDGLLGDESLDDYEAKNVLATLFGNRYVLATSTTGASPSLDLAQALALPMRTPASAGTLYAAMAFPAEAPRADYTWSFSLNAVNWGYDDDTLETPDEVQWP